MQSRFYDIKHNDGRLSRFTVRPMKDGNVTVDVCRYGKDGYYRADLSETSVCCPEEWEKELEKLERCQSPFGFTLLEI